MANPPTTPNSPARSTPKLVARADARDLAISESEPASQIILEFESPTAALLGAPGAGAVALHHVDHLLDGSGGGVHRLDHADRP